MLLWMAAKTRESVARLRFSVREVLLDKAITSGVRYFGLERVGVMCSDGFCVQMFEREEQAANVEE